MFFPSILLLFVFQLVNSITHDTTCAEDQKHFADICFTPKPIKNFDLGWFLGNEPDDGWYVELGNDISRLHFAEILQGKLLTLKDDLDHACFRVHAALGAEGLEANVTGFGGVHAKWDCTLSKDTGGLFLCDAKSDGPSKFHENFNIYPVYMDRVNLLIGAVCFPNGQAGWATMAGTPQMSEAERKVVAEEVKKLGFPFEDHVVIYDDKC